MTPPGKRLSAGFSAEERLTKMRQEAAEYIARFDLRMVLQEMFQKVIKDRPDDPFGFMQAFLRDGPAKRFEGSAEPEPCDSGDVGAGRPNVASVEADAVEEAKRTRDLAAAAATKKVLESRSREGSKPATPARASIGRATPGDEAAGSPPRRSSPSRASPGATADTRSEEATKTAAVGRGVVSPLVSGQAAYEASALETMSMTDVLSPVAGVAHALEAQQQAIQLLHSQLSSETQRREAAETHAQTMEEAFETLQLRLQAQLPGSPAAVAHVSPNAVTTAISEGPQLAGSLLNPNLSA